MPLSVALRMSVKDLFHLVCSMRSPRGPTPGLSRVYGTLFQAFVFKDAGLFRTERPSPLLGSGKGLKNLDGIAQDAQTKPSARALIPKLQAQAEWMQCNMNHARRTRARGMRTHMLHFGWLECRTWASFWSHTQSMPEANPCIIWAQALYVQCTCIGRMLLTH